MTPTEFEYSEDFAKRMDEVDPLRHFRSLFHFPLVDGREAIYFCGNSLGLQPKSVREYLDRELKNWELKAVDGHFHGEDAWYHVRKKSKPALAEIVCAHEHEEYSGARGRTAALA